ncbi:pseudouridylate synthase [Haloechinothrix sp. YIM 98757]|uniref:RNA pseudouridylate synthase n=1 Tax=Haloechinothrix aidingensis TaxID=2752311 RepID=A0A838AAB9_9PSEU|nr:pseudouridylate synthase [Haloechinothrix aidingensis]
MRYPARVPHRAVEPPPAPDGIRPTRLRLPATGRWRTLREYLLDRFPAEGPQRVDALFAEQRLVDRTGPVAREAPFVPGATLWCYREPPSEVPVPFEVSIVHRDDRVLVADKPHFLATTPRGSHVLETALVRLRRELDLPELTPAHRLDRPTAGLVLFVLRPELRGAYQKLFQHGLVHKTYEAVAGYPPSAALPRTVRSRIVKRHGDHRAREVSGPANSSTRVDLLEHRDGLGRYRLVPATGRTHQLRVHMGGLGVPILGDELYPSPIGKAPDDFGRPLQLLARGLAFTDPVSGEPRRFVSDRSLQAWTAYSEWARSPASR